MAAISKANHDSCVAAVKAAKDAQPNCYYIQRVLSNAIVELQSEFYGKRTDGTTTSYTPVLNDGSEIASSASTPSGTPDPHDVFKVS